MKCMFLLAVTTILMGGCITRNIKPSLIQFGNEYLDEVNNPGKLPAGSIIFLVDNYTHTAYCEKQIDSMAIKLGESKKAKHISYIIHFYKMSKKTNVPILQLTHGI